MKPFLHACTHSEITSIVSTGRKEIECYSLDDARTIKDEQSSPIVDCKNVFFDVFRVQLEQNKSEKRWKYYHKIQ